MKIVHFVTSNDAKFVLAHEALQKYSITAERLKLDLEEVQSDSGEAIARHKAQQAFDTFQQPIVVNDDTWSIPGLQGFPGPYMKYMNDWLTPDDWLRITLPLKDRRIFLQQHVVYQDRSGQHYFLKEIEGVILNEIRGHYAHSHLGLISYDGGEHSVAELRNDGDRAIPESKQLGWDVFGQWFKDYEKPSATDLPSIDRIAELQQLIADFSKIERVLPFADTNRLENDIDHSFGLAISCWFLASTIAPHLDLSKILRYSLAHDMIEIHSGDTYVFDEEAVKTKSKREADSLQKLKHDWPDFPDMTDFIEGYAEKRDAEARFVYTIDKLLPPILINLHAKSDWWHKQKITAKMHTTEKQNKMKESPEALPYLQALIDWTTNPDYFYKEQI